MGQENINIPNDWDRSGLPAWSFFNKEMFEDQKKWILENRKEVRGVSYEFDQLVKNEATEEDLRLFLESQKHNTEPLQASRNEK